MSKMGANQILVVGATGHLGMEICRQLVSTSEQIIGMVRTTSAPEKLSSLRKMGIKTVTADLKDSASVQRALQGIHTVISTASSTVARQAGDTIQSVDDEGQSKLVDAAIAAGVKHFIYVSFSFTPNDFPLQAAKKRVEKKILESNLSYTILKPSFFMESWLSPAIGFDYPNAKVNIFGAGDNKISWIAIHDVAAFAIAAVHQPSLKNRTLEIGGPEALSPKGVTEIFEQVFQRKFDAQFVPIAALHTQFDTATDDLTKTFAGLMLMYAGGQEVNMVETQALVPIKLKSVADHALEMAKPTQEISN